MSSMRFSYCALDVPSSALAASLAGEASRIGRCRSGRRGRGAVGGAPSAMGSSLTFSALGARLDDAALGACRDDEALEVLELRARASITRR